MEVQKIATEGKSVISETLKLTYSIYVKGDKRELTGEVRKDDDVIGRFNASNNGIIGFSLHDGNGLSADEINLVFSTFIEDKESVFQDA